MKEESVTVDNELKRKKKEKGYEGLREWHFSDIGYLTSATSARMDFSVIL
jgi:hypothetical protein